MSKEDNEKYKCYVALSLVLCIGLYVCFGILNTSGPWNDSDQWYEGSRTNTNCNWSAITSEYKIERRFYQLRGFAITAIVFAVLSPIAGLCAMCCHCDCHLLWRSFNVISVVISGISGTVSSIIFLFKYIENPPPCVQFSATTLVLWTYIIYVVLCLKMVIIGCCTCKFICKRRNKSAPL